MTTLILVSSLLFFCLYTASSAGVVDTLCGQGNATVVIAVPNICGTKTPKQPFCVNKGTEQNPVFVCRECDVNCDCPINFYCVKSAGPERGTCKSIDLDGKSIGKPCNNFNMPQEPMRLVHDPKFPKRGVDDQLVCGIPVFDNATGFFLFYEWLGYCKEGKCKACASWGPELGQTIDWLVNDEPGSLLCPGRQCVGGQLTTPNYAVDVEEQPIFNNLINVDTETGITGSILAFVILISLSNLVMCYCTVRSQFHPKNYKKLSQQL
jgi:hypothetical protein